MSNSENRKNKKVWIVLLIFFVLVFFGSLFYLFSGYFLPKNTDKKYKNNQTVKTEEKLPDNPIDFNSLKKDNVDAIAWLKVDGTPIDYPIMMSGDDKVEDFYINHDISLQSKKYGSIYVQRHNSKDFTDFNTIIYGHNMSTVRWPQEYTMFGTLKQFRDRNFFDTNRNIYVYIPNHILHYEIVSAFVHDDRHLLSAYSFFTKEGRMEYASVCKNPNTRIKNVVEGLEITDEDRLITLSTCTSAENERYLVIGKLVSDTETN